MRDTWICKLMLRDLVRGDVGNFTVLAIVLALSLPACLFMYFGYVAEGGVLAEAASPRELILATAVFIVSGAIAAFCLVSLVLGPVAERKGAV